MKGKTEGPLNGRELMIVSDLEEAIKEGVG